LRPTSWQPDIERRPPLRHPTASSPFMTQKILVVGGAGYIGSHMVLRLAQAGHDVVVYDNLGSGHRDAVLAGQLVVGDLSDRAALWQLFSAHRFDAVMHFASSIQVGESMVKPARY